jgi:hypothetical protein
MKQLAIVLALSLVLLTGCDALNLGKVNKVAAEGDAVAAIAFSLLEKPVDGGPAPDNKSDICQFCNGTGKVGDGRIVAKCLACDGTGKKKVTSAEGVMLGIVGLESRLEELANKLTVKEEKACDCGEDGCDCVAGDVCKRCTNPNCRCRCCKCGPNCECGVEPARKVATAVTQPVPTSGFSKAQYNGLGELVHYNFATKQWELAAVKQRQPEFKNYSGRVWYSAPSSCAQGGCR